METDVIKELRFRTLKSRKVFAKIWLVEFSANQSITKLSKCVPTEKLKITSPNQKEFYPKVLENKKKETSIRQFLEESSERSSLEQRGVFESTVARIEVAFDWLMKVLDESNGSKGLTTTEIVEHYEGKGLIFKKNHFYVGVFVDEQTQGVIPGRWETPTQVHIPCEEARAVFFRRGIGLTSFSQNRNQPSWKMETLRTPDMRTIPIF